MSQRKSRESDVNLSRPHHHLIQRLGLLGNHAESNLTCAFSAIDHIAVRDYDFW